MLIAEARVEAERGALTLCTDAPAEESVRRLQHGVADHLELFGRRDQLMVTWSPSHGASEALPETAATPGTGGRIHG